MSPDRRRRHVGTEVLLDLLEDRLTPAKRRDAEAHLGGPCPDCRARLRALAELTGQLRAGALDPVPDALHQVALGAFSPAATVSEPAGAALWRTLRLAFDSLAQPLPAAARRSVGEARRLRFELPGARLEVEHESESAEQCVLRGRIEVATPELYRIEVHSGDERARHWADADGAFLFEGLPRGECRLFVSGPDGRFETPPFET